MTAKKGFTLIELLVVIAIIGILSAVVLTSLNSARNKAKDAKIKAELAGVRAAMELYYDNHATSYSGACADATITPYRTSIAQTAGVASVCYDAANAYAISSVLPGAGGTWCVSSAGTNSSSTAQTTAVCS